MVDFVEEKRKTILPWAAVFFSSSPVSRRSQKRWCSEETGHGYHGSASSGTEGKQRDGEEERKRREETRHENEITTTARDRCVVLLVFTKKMSGR